MLVLLYSTGEIVAAAAAAAASVQLCCFLHFLIVILRLVSSVFLGRLEKGADFKTFETLAVGVQVSSAYLDQVSDARRRPEDDPLVHRHRLLALVLLDGDVAPEEEQRERGHLGAVVQEDLRRRWWWWWGGEVGEVLPAERDDKRTTRTLGDGVTPP